MKPITLATSVFILASLAGLFFKWAEVGMKHASGLNHWSGLLILLSAITAMILIQKSGLNLITLIMMLMIPILSYVQFMHLPPILYLSGIDLPFSREIVQSGFFITMFSSLTAIFLHVLSLIWPRKSAIEEPFYEKSP